MDSSSAPMYVLPPGKAGPKSKIPRGIEGYAVQNVPAKRLHGAGLQERLAHGAPRHDVNQVYQCARSPRAWRSRRKVTSKVAARGNPLSHVSALNSARPKWVYDGLNDRNRSVL